MNRNLNLRDELVRFIRDSIIDHGDFLREAGNLQAMVTDEGDQLLILGRRVGMAPAEPKRHAPEDSGWCSGSQTAGYCNSGMEP